MTCDSYAHTVKRSVTCALALIAIVAGCSQGGTEASDQTRTSPPSAGPGVPQQRDESTPATNAERRAVIDDWYDNGKVDDSHRCTAVRAAIEGLATALPDTTSAAYDLRRIERVCCAAKRNDAGAPTLARPSMVGKGIEHIQGLSLRARSSTSAG